MHRMWRPWLGYDIRLCSTHRRGSRPGTAAGPFRFTTESVRLLESTQVVATCIRPKWWRTPISNTDLRCEEVRGTLFGSQSLSSLLLRAESL